MRRSHHPLEWAALCAALLLLARCDCTGQATGSDAGSPADAGGNDAGPRADAGPRDAGSTDAGPGTTDAGPGDAGGNTDAGTSDAGSTDAGPADSGTVSSSQSVLEYHGNPSHDGHYVFPALTLDAGAGVHRDLTFNGTIDTGMNNAQPLYWENGASGVDLVIAATESNQVTALRATDGQPAWQVTLGNPVPLNGGGLGCGNIDPLGITGTPVIDANARTLYLDAMTPGPAHKLYALSLDDGGTRTSFPIPLETALSGASFMSAFQSQRGALTIQGGVLYVPYGGYYGDCGSYHGIVAGFPLSNPANVGYWATGANKGGIWSAGGISSDGTSIFAVTGNTAGSSTWVGGEGVVRFAIGGNLAAGPADDYFPTNWLNLDNTDIDLGGCTESLVTVPGATPTPYVAALGKDGDVYLLNRNNLGSAGLAGGGGELEKLKIAPSDAVGGGMFGAATTYSTPSGTYVVVRANAGGTACPVGQSGSLIAVKVTTGTPHLSVAWCRNPGGAGSPIVTTTDALGNNAIVWITGAEGDNKLHGFNGDTGAVVFAGGGANEQMGTVDHFSTILVAKGRLFVGGEGKVYAFTP